MNKLSAGKLVVRHSQFFGYLYEIDEKDEIKDILKLQRSLHKKANHCCYALRFSINSNKIFEIFRDDGEVGRPGRVLLDILIKYDLKNHVLLVSRIFGGVKLGVGGVSRAFRKVGEAVVKHHK